MKMKKLLIGCCLSRVADFSSQQQQQQILKDVGATHTHRGDHGRRRGRRRHRKVTCPQGHVPVYVGEGEGEGEGERFAVPAHLLSRPVFAQVLLRQSAQEYGYDQKGVLRIPCSVPLFRSLLAHQPPQPRRSSLA